LQLHDVFTATPRELLFAAMTPFQVRRATVQELPQLLALWKLDRLPVEILEKRFTEFQVVLDGAGTVLATVGLQIAGTDAALHSEAIARPELADELRQQLWDRLQSVFHNHAIERVWTQLSAPFWRMLGFERAQDDQLASKPASLGNDGVWQVLPLRAADATAALEKQFTLLKTMQQQESQRLRDRVQLWKKVALIVTLIVFGLVIAWAVVLLRFGPQLMRR
jgi:N-acetylglutamate synthase-like GNAT family acetyltransferase